MIRRTLVSYAVCAFMISIANAANPPEINNEPQQPTAPQAQACNPSANNNQSIATNNPAGTYTTRNSDGSSNTVYTTGEKKPYIVDNGCSNTGAPVIQPYIAMQPPTTGPAAASAPAVTAAGRAQN